MTEFAGSQYVIEIVYLVASALFILSLKWMSSPATARHGILAGEIGMVLAIAGTLLHHGIVDYKWIIIGLVLGSGIGIPLGMVQMTAVPQRTALSHAFGALCVTLVGTAEFYLRSPDVSKFMMSVLSMEVILGGLTFTGSLMAAGKLQEILPQRPITYKGQNLVNLLLFTATVASAVYLVLHPEAKQLFPVVVGTSLVIGVLLVIPIGGADMPTVISLLNSYAGLSAAAMGFVLNSKLLIIAGRSPMYCSAPSDKCRLPPPREKRQNPSAAPRPKKPPRFCRPQTRLSSFRATAWPSPRHNIKSANSTTF
jgi:H+-translocating NAD(P) transhydrogenase subunit beta